MYDRATRGPLQPDESNVPRQSLTHAIPVQMFAIQYGDSAGKVHKTIAYKIGGVWHLDTKDNRGEKWASELGKAAPWLAQQLDDMVESKAAPLPADLDPANVAGAL